MTHTTAEMAVRLKDAGWPQPEIKYGQIWAHEGDLLILTSIADGSLGFDYEGGFYDRGRNFGLDDFAYCPSVIELMQSLADLNADPQLEMDNGQFFSRTEKATVNYRSGHNPADLFGELWLIITQNYVKA